MSNEKVTALPTVSAATTADIIYAVQSGTSVQETLAQVLSLASSSIIQSYAGNPNGNVAGTTYNLLWDTTDSVLYICTTSGSTTTAVWTVAGSFSFPLSLAQGGTGASLTASNGGIFYSTASAAAILAGTATAHQVLLSGSSTTPAWSTATYPATTTVNQLLYSSSTNTIAGVTAANSGVLVSTSSGAPTWVGPLTNGQLVIGSTSGTPVASTLTAGSGISISNSTGSITISGTGSGIGWNEVTGTSQLMVADSGYVANNGALVTLTLPATAAFGTAISVIGKGVGGWSIVLGTGQSIQVGSVATTVTTGSVSSTNRFDSIDLICTTANTVWTTLGAPQSAGLTIV